VIECLNAIDWAPDLAIAALAPLAPHIPLHEAEGWLARHCTHLQSTHLTKRTPLARKTQWADRLRL
jgi:hypothetical protein